MKNIDGEIIVVDNNSSDGSLDFFTNHFYNVNFIWNKTNFGFAKANNQALKIAKGDYILCLNPDTLVPEDCFEKCIHFIQTKENKIALGIKMIDGSGNFLKESKRGFPTPSTSFYKLSGLSKLFPNSKTFSRYHLGYLNENKNHEVDVLAGAFMMIPKKILDKTGNFDEDFFMYGEDIDLSFRVQKAGFKNYYFAESSIIHFKGESTKKETFHYVKIFYKAMSVFVKKHYGNKQAGLFGFFIQIAIFSRAALAAGSRFFRRFFSNFDFRKNQANPDEKDLIVIAGSETEFENVIKTKAKIISNHPVLKRIEPEDLIRETDKISDFKNVNRFIFCEGELSFKEIINILPKINKSIKIHLFSTGSHTIIGSNE